MGAYEQERARQRGDALVEMGRKDSAGGMTLPFMPSNQLGALGTFMENTSKLQSTFEQLRHYRDWVFAVIRPIANRISGQEIFMAVEDDDTAGEERAARPGGRKASAGKRRPTKQQCPAHLRTKSANLEIVGQHQFLDAINNPNPLMTRWTLIYLLVAHMELTGKAYWWFTPDPETGKMQIWPLTPSWVTPKHENGKLFSAYAVIPPGSAGEPKDVPGEQIAYFHYPDPQDPFGAVGFLQSQARAVSSDESIQLAQAVSFKNSIYPGLAIIVGDALDPTGTAKRPLLDRDQRADILAPIKDQYRGVLKHGEPIILDALVRDVKQISLKPAEMDFLNSGTQTKQRIFQGAGINPIIAGEVENANKASAAVADEHFCNAINPKADLIGQVMTKVLGPALARPGQKLHIWIDPCRPNDSDGRRQDFELLVKAGAVTVNELRRELCNLAPLEDGDVLYVPATMTAVAAFGVGEKKNNQPASAKRRPVMTVKEYAGVWLKLHQAGERDLQNDLQALFKSEAKSIAAALRERLDASDKALDLLRIAGQKNAGQGADLAGQVFRPGDWTEKLKEIARPHLLKAAAVGAALEISAVKRLGAFSTKDDDAADISVDIPQPVLSEIKSTLNTVMDQPYWQGINDTVLKDLGSTLEKSIADGDSLNVIIGKLDAVLGSESDRAETIARTEMTGAMNSGHYAARQELIDEGLITGSEWVSTEDGLVRPTHAAADGQIVKKGEQFTVGGQHAPYPGYYGLSASERVHCRCTTVAAGTFADDEGEKGGTVRLSLPCCKHVGLLAYAA